MEQKLLDLKEQFCKWYCPNRDRDLNLTEKCMEYNGCKKCYEVIHCDDFYMDGKFYCETCQVGEYIRFIRDDI